MDNFFIHSKRALQTPCNTLLLLDKLKLARTKFDAANEFIHETKTTYLFMGDLTSQFLPPSI